MATTSWTDNLPKEESEEELETNEQYESSIQSVMFVIESTATMLSPTESIHDVFDPYAAAASGVSGEWDGVPATSRMEVVLRHAYATMRRKITSSPRDQIGVYIFNTMDTSDDRQSRIKDLQTVLKMGLPTMKRIAQLRLILQNIEENANLLAESYPPAVDGNTLHLALQDCVTVFRSVKGRTRKRIFLITDNDDPYPDDKGHERFVIDRIVKEDFVDCDITIEPFFVAPEESRPFDLDLIYGPLLMKEEDDRDAPATSVQHDLTTTFSRMMKLMATKESLKRVTYTISFEIAKDVVIGVQGYSLVRPATKGKMEKVNLNTAAGESIIYRTQYKAAIADVTLQQEDIRKYYQLGSGENESHAIDLGPSDLDRGTLSEEARRQSDQYSDKNNDFLETSRVGRHSQVFLPGGVKQSTSTPHEASIVEKPSRAMQRVAEGKVFLTKDDREGIKNLGYPCGLFLLGFYSRDLFLDTIKIIKHSDFIYPDEAQFHGSTTTFTALLTSMLSTDKVAVGILRGRKGSTIRHVLIMPQMEEMSPEGLQLTAPGMHLIKLPFADDLRAPDCPLGASLTQGSVETQAMKDVISKLKMKGPYNPARYPSPSLNYHYSLIGAIATDDPMPPWIDSSLPSDQIDTRACTLMTTFLAAMSIHEGDNTGAVVSNQKRRLTADPHAPAPDLTEFKNEYRRALELDKSLTVPKLKEGLGLMGLSKTGRKEELIERIDAEFARLRKAKKQRRAAKREANMDEEGEDERGEKMVVEKERDGDDKKTVEILMID